MKSVQQGGDVIKYVGVPRPLCLGLGVFPDCGSLECANSKSCNKTLQSPDTRPRHTLRPYCALRDTLLGEESLERWKIRMTDGSFVLKLEDVFISTDYIT